MEIRVLQYFLAVAREQSISGAAESLHLSQPTLSRQLKDMEEELGKQLFIRGSRKILLTEEGMLLRKRAEEIIDLVKKTENEITLSSDEIAGDIYIGAGETDTIRLIASVAKSLQEGCPDIHFHMFSGDAYDVIERLDRGLIDFGILFGPIDMAKYDNIELPTKDIWGVLMQKDSELAQKTHICPEDLIDKPLIASQQSLKTGVISNWFKKYFPELNFVASYNLLFNGSLMVAEGLGYALSLDRIINTSGNSRLCFRPLHPKIEMTMHIVWKKHQIFSKASAKFLQMLAEEFSPK